MLLFLKIIQYAAARGCVLPHVHQYVTSTRMASFTIHFSQQHHGLTSRQKPSAIVSRLFSRQMPRLPLDAENLTSVITEDIPVFTYRNNRFFWLLTIFGGLQFLCWANIALFINADSPVENSQKQKPQKSTDSWMHKFYADNRIKIAATCFGFGKQIPITAFCCNTDFLNE